MDHSEQIQDLFAAALKHDPDERPAFLDEACAGDPDLYAEVYSLLNAAARTGRFDRLADQLMGPSPDQDHAASLAGQHIGSYRLERVLGRGGMGTVFLAKRMDGQFEQQVALKLLRYDVVGEGPTRRFLAERQILARLTHPNICRVFDGGVTTPTAGQPGDNRPYFVMEYVDGIPIDQYCDAHQLTVRERLALFRTVCAAVHYAHQNLVIHRDLKPSNILVAEPAPEQSGNGTVKLLDFGIAKLLDPETHPQSLVRTRTGMRLMTPEYASPEQVRSEPVTTATDVYQLGVLLYELLTGRRPYQLPSRSLHEVERIICEEVPEKPSTAVSRVAETEEPSSMVTPAQVSRARSTSTERLRRRLSGDLDNIVLTAMRKEPERRYASAEQLGEDIRRHLAELPVRAQSDTFTYRASKFVRRHRFGVMATAGVMVLLAAFGLATAYQATQIAQERDKAMQVSAFLVDLFERSDPNEALGDTLTVREVLDEGGRRVRSELAAQSDVQATMMDVIGRVYVNLGLYDAARPLLEEALAIRKQTLGAMHLDIATSLSHVAWLFREQGDYEAAEPLYREALAMRRAMLGEEHLDVADVLSGLGDLLYAKRDLDAADSLFREALAINRNAYGEESPEIAERLNDVAVVVHTKGDYEQAALLYNEVLTIYRKVHGDVHPEIAVTLSNLGWLHQARDDLDSAETVFREALTMRRTLYGEAHPKLARSLSALAQLLSRKGNNQAAEPLAREALAMRRTLLGTRHPDVAESLLSLGGIMGGQGDYTAAEMAYQEALDMYRETIGEESLDVARVSNDLASLLRSQGDYARAEPYYREALRLYRKNLGDDHLFTAIVLSNLAYNVHAQDQYDQAEPMYREALEKMRAVRAEDDPGLAIVLVNLGRLLLDRHAYQDAEPVLREGLTIQQKKLSDGHVQTLQTQMLLGRCLTALQQYDAAEPLLLDSYGVLNEKSGDQDPYTVQALDLLIDLYQAWDKSDQAEVYQAVRSEAKQ